jgi:hypothetical protein
MGDTVLPSYLKLAPPSTSQAKASTDVPSSQIKPNPMPPRLPTTLPKWPLHLTKAVFFCPSCSTWRCSLPAIPTHPRSLGLRRPASRMASSSAINAAKNVPERFKQLYDALAGVRDAAANHVNLSRLQLAQRGLETERPLIRVAGTLGWSKSRS